MGEMRGVDSYLHLFVREVRGRVDNERLGGDRCCQVVNQYACNLPRPFGCRLGSAYGIHDGVPKEREPARTWSWGGAGCGAHAIQIAYASC